MNNIPLYECVCVVFLIALLTPKVWIFFSDSKYMWFCHIKTNSQTPTKCPTIQFNADNIELAQTPRMKVSVPQDCPHFRCQHKWDAANTSACLTTISGAPVTNLRYDNSLEQLIEFRKMLT